MDRESTSQECHVKLPASNVPKETKSEVGKTNIQTFTLATGIQIPLVRIDILDNTLAKVALSGRSVL
jgi:hypothetical protein